MKKKFGICVEEDIFKKFQKLCIDLNVRQSEYLEILIKSEIDKRSKKK